MKKKISLKTIKVSSFITADQAMNTATVKGGGGANGGGTTIAGVVRSEWCSADVKNCSVAYPCLSVADPCEH